MVLTVKYYKILLICWGSQDTLSQHTPALPSALPQTQLKNVHAQELLQVFSPQEVFGAHNMLNNTLACLSPVNLALSV